MSVSVNRSTISEYNYVYEQLSRLQICKVLACTSDLEKVVLLKFLEHTAFYLYELVGDEKREQGMIV